MWSARYKREAKLIWGGQNRKPAEYVFMFIYGSAPQRLYCKRGQEGDQTDEQSEG